jgi:hypothetical protein
MPDAAAPRTAAPAMQRSADSIYARLDGLGASLVSLVAVALQVLAAVGRAMNGGI